MVIYIGSSYVWPRPARGTPRSGECASALGRAKHGEPEQHANKKHRLANQGFIVPRAIR